MHQKSLSPQFTITLPTPVCACTPFIYHICGCLKNQRFLGKNKNSYLCHQKLVFKPPTSTLGCWAGHLTSCTCLVSCLNWAAATAAYLAQSRLVWLLCNPSLMQAPAQRETLRLRSLPRPGQILTRGVAGLHPASPLS